MGRLDESCKIIAVHQPAPANALTGKLAFYEKCSHAALSTPKHSRDLGHGDKLSAFRYIQRLLLFLIRGVFHSENTFN